MAEYVPSPREWVANQVELYESSGGTAGLTLRDTGMPVIVVTKPVSAFVRVIPDEDVLVKSRSISPSLLKKAS